MAASPPLDHSLSMNATMPNDAITLDQYVALPSDDRFIDEVSRGRLVREPRPGFEHGIVVTRLCLLLARYFERHPIGRVIVESGFVLASAPLAIRGPDVAVILNHRIPSDDIKGFFHGAPDIAIEVVSPSNRPGELLSKVAEFLEAGAQSVWVVYPRTQTVVIHDSDGEIFFYDTESTITSPAVLPNFELPVERIFRD
jgi:Uma2 family endonuclease